MNKKQMFNRRTLLSSTVAITGVGLLAACGGSKNEEKTKAAGKGANVEDLYDINAHPIADLKQGGELRLPLSSIGPDFNTFSTSGASGDTQTAMGTIYSAGLWSVTAKGELELNKDFAVSFDQKEEGGNTVVYIEVNKKAKFNDGTPVDYKALQATWNISKSTSGEYKIVSSGIYENVKSVERNGDDYKVKVTMAKPYYPINELFGSILHPGMADPKVFNDGFVNNPHPEFGSGPFKLAANGWNTTEKTFTVVPNEKWWGEKPVLDRIIFRALEDNAVLAAFKNSEIDAASARTATAYADLKNTANAELRKGQRLFSGGLNLNPKRIADVKVRKAIFIGTNREALAKIRYQGLPWEEELPGSRLYLPFEEYYEDNYPKVDGDAKEAAQKLLEEAGYKKDGDFYAKNGKQLTYKTTTFGDDPVNNGMAQTFVQNMKELGIKFTIESRGSLEFASVVATEKDYDMTFSGFGITVADGTSSTKQFYYSKDNDGVGTPEIDKMIEEMQLIKDDVERNKKCNEIEKKHMAEVSTIGTVFNGCDFMMCKKGLANYGPALFKSIDWAQVGWLK